MPGFEGKKNGYGLKKKCSVHGTDRHTWATERLPKLVKGVLRSVRLPEAGSTTARLPPALRGSEYNTNSLPPQHAQSY